MALDSYFFVSCVHEGLGPLGSYLFWGLRFFGALNSAKFWGPSEVLFFFVCVLCLIFFLGSQVHKSFGFLGS